LLKVDYTSTKEKELLLKHILFSATELDDIVRDIVDATQQEEI
jgi:hypothetical protein